MILKQLPYLTSLNCESTSISQSEDENKGEDAEYRFDNIDRLQIYPKLPSKEIICLIKHFPKMIDLYAECEFDDPDLHSILGAIGSNNLAHAQYLRSVTLMKKTGREELINEIISIIDSLKPSLDNQCFSNYSINKGDNQIILRMTPIKSDNSY